MAYRRRSVRTTRGYSRGGYRSRSRTVQRRGRGSYSAPRRRSVRRGVSRGGSRTVRVVIEQAAPASIRGNIPPSMIGMMPVNPGSGRSKF